MSEHNGFAGELLDAVDRLSNHVERLESEQKKTGTEIVGLRIKMDEVRAQTSILFRQVSDGKDSLTGRMSSLEGKCDARHKNGNGTKSGIFLNNAVSAKMFLALIALGTLLTTIVAYLVGFKPAG